VNSLQCGVCYRGFSDLRQKFAHQLECARTARKMQPIVALAKNRRLNLLAVEQQRAVSKARSAGSFRTKDEMLRVTPSDSSDNSSNSSSRANSVHGKEEEVKTKQRIRRASHKAAERLRDEVDNSNSGNSNNSSSEDSSDLEVVFAKLNGHGSDQDSGYGQVTSQPVKLGRGRLRKNTFLSGPMKRGREEELSGSSRSVSPDSRMRLVNDMGSKVKRMDVRLSPLKLDMLTKRISQKGKK